MINIFNLFLTLFFFWALFAYSNDNLSWLYIVFGLVASIATSFTAWKIKIINKHSRFLFLHLGFYKHFLGLIFSSFFQSLLIIFRVTISSFKIDPKIYSLPIKNLNNAQLVLLIPTINLMPGVLFVGFEDQKIIIFGLGDSYVKKLDLDKIINNLEKVNDSRLV